MKPKPWIFRAGRVGSTSWRGGITCPAPLRPPANPPKVDPDRYVGVYEHLFFTLPDGSAHVHDGSRATPGVS